MLLKSGTLLPGNVIDNVILSQYQINNNLQKMLHMHNT